MCLSTFSPPSIIILFLTPQKSTTQEAPTQSALGFIPLALTILVHAYLVRNVLGPLENLSLEVAAQVDIQNGEWEGAVDDSLYAQPSLKDQAEDREPLPYRRDAQTQDRNDEGQVKDNVISFQQEDGDVEVTNMC